MEHSPAVAVKKVCYDKKKICCWNHYPKKIFNQETSCHVRSNFEKKSSSGEVTWNCKRGRAYLCPASTPRCSPDYVLHKKDICPCQYKIFVSRVSIDSRNFISISDVIRGIIIMTARDIKINLTLIFPITEKTPFCSMVVLNITREMIKSGIS